MSTNLKNDDIDTLVDLLTKRAADSLTANTPQEYFRNLASSAHLPKKWQAQMAGRFSGNADMDARKLIDFATLQRINPEDYRYTTLGALLRAVLREQPPPDDAQTIVSMIVAYGLVLDKQTLDEIKLGYAVPFRSGTPASAEISYGPDFRWRADESDLELQGFFTPEMPWQDVGFLKRAIACSSSVCRVEIGKITGTGFVVAPALVLTNYHVLKPTDDANLEMNAKEAVLRFAAFTGDKGAAEAGLEFKLDADGPIVAHSVVSEYDFVLLRAEAKIHARENIQPLALDLSVPGKKSGLNLLHHPGGDTMKLSTSGNGVSGVYEDVGLLQYVTNAAEGSSGSPCFTDDWKVIALHHAQRSRAWGSVREGILMKNVQAQIQQHL